MKYVYVGKKIADTGKPLWEIVGNLKNFGVGRLIKTSSSDLYSELCFMKIVKVQPLPPNKKEGENRPVMIWVDEIYRDCKKPTKELIKNTDVAKYKLISKIEGEEYLKRAAELKTPEIHVEKYMSWPPLYKKLWEEEYGTEIPKLKTVIEFTEGCNYILDEVEKKPATCSLYKGSQTVDEMYKELVRLRKIIELERLGYLKACGQLKKKLETQYFI